jgi:hypothetical protein
MREQTAISVTISAVEAQVYRISRGVAEPGNRGGGARVMRGILMKKSLGTVGPTLMLLAFAGACLSTDVAVAAAADDEVERGRQMIREGRLEIVRSELHLTDDEGVAFWPLYSRYRDETDAIQDRYAAMITEYIRRYDDADLTDEYADELIDAFLAIKFELLGVQKKYLPDFRAVLPALKVARLFQLENKINAEIDAQMALVVPLVDPS